MIQASWTWWGWGGWPVLRPGPSSGPSQTSSADSWWWWEGLWPSTAQLKPSCHRFWGFPATGLEGAIYRYFYINGCQTKMFCLITAKYHNKQQSGINTGRDQLDGRAEARVHGRGKPDYRSYSWHKRGGGPATAVDATDEVGARSPQHVIGWEQQRSYVLTVS
jgi:hypothetical protein